MLIQRSSRTKKSIAHSLLWLLQERKLVLLLLSNKRVTLSRIMEGKEARVEQLAEQI